jgi:methionyl-tRNA synthetase
MNNKPFFITTPIYYVNDKPHIGHAYTSVACDVIARFMRLSGCEVKFLTGTDEHGQKVEKSAKLAGKEPQEFVDGVSKQFRDMATLMNISNDDFIRTTESRHKASAQALWARMAERGYIYDGKYSGWYAVRDEAYYAESELVGGKAPTGAEVEWVEEPSYFFKLSAFESKLLKFYKENQDAIAPSSRKNEVISFVEGGLRDISISRTTFSWGIPVLGDEKHVMYVWLDALANYLSALDFTGDVNSAEMQKWWPASLHLVGKDILRFHAVYWPAFLMAAELPLPERVFAHGWWTVEGEKMSKSLGNVVAPADLVADFGLDQTRWFLMREVPFGSDGNFARDAMRTRINADLSNNVGNLVQRTLSMIYKNCDGKIPECDWSVFDENIQHLCYDSIEKHKNNVKNQMLHIECEEIISLSSLANEYIDRMAPWTLKKTDPQKMQHVLYALAEMIRCIGIYLQPFMPYSSSKILDTLNIPLENRSFASLRKSHALAAGAEIQVPKAIFPRIEAA